MYLFVTTMNAINSKTDTQARIIVGPSTDLPSKEIDDTPETVTPSISFVAQSNSTENGLALIYQLPNGMWGFRYAFWVNGKQKDIKRTKDDNGNPFKTEKAAMKARESAIIQVQSELSQPQKSPKKRVTVAEVFAEYCETGRCGKAYGTTRKQDSLWKNHLSTRFGKRYVDDISVSEVMDYLSLLYYQEGRAYSYVEAFLKMFYLIFGQAYSRGYLNVDTYNTLCEELNDAFVVKGRGYGYTFRPMHSMLRIDYILVPQNVTCLSHTTHKVELSDHYPTIAEIVVPVQ